MIATTLEQSRKLVELGIDLSTADMYWDSNTLPPIVFPMLLENDVQNDYEYMQENGLIPAWSLNALLKILPFPTISNDNIGKEKSGWQCSVYPDNTRYDSIWHDNPIEACVEMIFTLKQRNLI